MKHTMHLSVSSAESSPYPSPFGSPIQSPTRSRKSSPIAENRSPFGSPTLTLKRANSYKHKTKKSSSHIDDVIRKRKLHNRFRSKSATDINSLHLKDEKHSLSPDNSDNDDDIDVLHCSASPVRDRSPESHGSYCLGEQKKSLATRKKSLTALFDLKKIMDSKPKLMRSQSQRISRQKEKDDQRSKKTGSFCADEDGQQKYKGPLFQATTMFVPGYDFKTKQSTPLISRKQSTPIFGRRGSKEKLQPALEAQKEKQKSTPNLVRKGSKDKLKMSESKQEELERADSLPSDITPLTTAKGNMNEDGESLSIEERKSALTLKLRHFAEHAKVGLLSLEVPHDAIHGRVKAVKSCFEHGTPFWKKYTKQKKKFERDRKHRSCEIEHDSIYRQRARSYENGEAFAKTTSYSSLGTESGYASPSDSSSDACSRADTSEASCTKYVQPKIILSSPAFYETLSNSWSDGDWRAKKLRKGHILTPDLARVYSTDLCVTEL